MSGGAGTEARPRLGAFFLLACTSSNISRPFFQSKGAVPLTLQPFSGRPQWRQTPAPVRLQPLQSSGSELEPPGQVQPVPWSCPNVPLSRAAQRKGFHEWVELSQGSLLSLSLSLSLGVPGPHSPSRALPGKLAAHYIRNANAGESGPGIRSRGSTRSEALGGGRSAVGETREAKPEGCAVVVAALGCAGAWRGCGGVWVPQPSVGSCC